MAQRLFKSSRVVMKDTQNTSMLHMHKACSSINVNIVSISVNMPNKINFSTSVSIYCLLKATRAPMCLKETLRPCKYRQHQFYQYDQHQHNNNNVNTAIIDTVSTNTTSNRQNTRNTTNVEHRNNYLY